MDQEFVKQVAEGYGMIPLTIWSRSMIRFRFPTDQGYLKPERIGHKHVYTFELIIVKTALGRLIVTFNEHGEQTFRTACAPQELHQVLSPLVVHYAHSL